MTNQCLRCVLLRLFIDVITCIVFFSHEEEFFNPSSSWKTNRFSVRATFRLVTCSFQHFPLHRRVTHRHTHTHTRSDIWGGKCAARRLRVPLMITTLHLNNLHPSSSTLTSALSLSLKSLSTPPKPLPPSPPHFHSLLFILPASFLSVFLPREATIAASFFFFCSICLDAHQNPLIWRICVHVFFLQPPLKSIFNDDVISAFICNLARVSV